MTDAAGSVTLERAFGTDVNEHVSDVERCRGVPSATRKQDGNLRRSDNRQKTDGKTA